jgi:hypothetical protein
MVKLMAQDNINRVKTTFRRSGNGALVEEPSSEELGGRRLRIAHIAID